ncbi:MAG TPA: tetratricopeptide repeat protein, partial [Alphaproteobacteria bacterium]|nr:tetratricopeptide repeat protein [Alphaproteobacteria bacterium]
MPDMTSTQSMFDAAVAKHQAGDIGAAAQLYRAIIDIEPDNAEALHMLGIIAQQRQNPELALRLMDAALAKNPNLALAWCNRATILRALNRRDEALQSAEKAIAIDPTMADGWDMAGSLLREQDKLQESLAHHARAIELQPENLRYRSNYTVLLL